MDTETKHAALQAVEAGISVIPILPATNSGSKRPAVPWKQFQTTRPTPQQVENWFDNPNHGLGVVCGSVSGNLEMIEVEGRAAHHLPELAELACNSGLGDLWDQMTTGWFEQSPTGGYHFYVKCVDPVGGNRKLARRPSTETELEANPRVRVQVLAETRGEGGYSVIAPTPGRFHENGKPWSRLLGGPATVPTFTRDELDSIHDIFASLGEPLEPEPTETDVKQPQPANGIIDGVKPGDDFNQRMEWANILIPQGWKPVFKRGATTYWRRPGKSSGVSATTGHDPEKDRLFVFSTSTSLQEETPLNKFHVYAHYHYGGDYKAAAKHLIREGYGKPKERIITPTDITRPNNETATLTTQNTDADTSGEPVVEGNPLAEIITMPGQQATSLAGSEDYDALEIVDRYQHVIAYCSERGRWLYWNGKQWEWQDTTGGYVRELARMYARTIDSEEKGWKKAALRNSGVTARLALAATDVRVNRKHEEFDSHHLELNTPGGIVNLETGELMEHDPAKLHTKITRVTPRKMPTPKWDKFLDQTFNEDAELIGYVRDLLGYAATGVVRQHLLPFFYGPGGNGKSVLTDTIMHLLGDYAGSAPSNFLMQKTTSQHETEIARLSGLRFVVSSEINPDAKFDEAKVKLLTGGDQLTARRMREDFFDFRPTHKLFLMGNHQPKVSSGGPSFWRRLRLIGFMNQVPKDQVVEGLSDQLIDEEGPGILQWLIEGAQNMLTNGLHEPASVLAASEEYAEEEDTFGRFVEENLDLSDPNGSEPQKEVRARYEAWCLREGERPLTQNKMSRELKNRFNITTTPISGIRFYEGVRLYAVGPEPDYDDPYSDLGGGY